MPYTPGEHYIICDISGQKVLRGQAKRTWDGFLVHPDFWYPRHPQLSVRGVPDDMGVTDGRPRQYRYVESTYGTGDIVLLSPNGTTYWLRVLADGTVLLEPGAYRDSSPDVVIGNYVLGVTDDGVLTVTGVGSENAGPNAWLLVSITGTVYTISMVSGVMLVEPAI